MPTKKPYHMIRQKSQDMRFPLAVPFILLICMLVSFEVQAQTTTENYIKTTTYKIETTSSIGSPTAAQAMVEINYIDGLGRIKQKIEHAQSGNGDDLVTPIVYDGFGRQIKEYLPYEQSASLNFDGSAEASASSFYNTLEYDNTTNPYTEKEIEISPLGRVLKQAAPGTDWEMGSGHEVKFSYETNASSELYYFTVSLSGSDPTLVYEGYYPDGELYKTVTKDENWEAADGQSGTMTQYTDKMGRMILKRIYEGTQKIDTYYVYDDYGNLSFVLSPKLSEQIISGGSLVGNHAYLLDELGYQYRYDHRNRMIRKQLPGKHQEFMVYDILNRVTAVGPSLSPFGDGAEGWLHTKYDIHNRVVYTLWKQGTVDLLTQETLSNAPVTYISENRTSGASTVNNVSFNYSNSVEPTSGYHVLTVNYYDDYEYTGAPASIPTTVGEGDSDVYYNKTTHIPTGLSTGNWTRVLETSAQTNAIESYSLYDKKSRPVRVKITHPSNGYTQVDTKYDFTGNTVYAQTKHKKDAAASVLTLKDTYTYNDQERVVSHTHKSASATPQLMTYNEYDALGRLIEKKTGGTNTSGSSGLQHVDYKYNVRGWLTDINNVASLAQSGDPLDLFAFQINYTEVTDAINGAVEELYNGNIAETFWRTSSDNVRRKYGFSYDDQNRIRDAYYQIPGATVPRANSYNASYSYDKNGNLMTLERNGEQDDANNVIPIDDLVYSYDDGNKLMIVKDLENFSAGYDDAHTTTGQDDFAYDTYGNLTLDKDKDITAINYNHLNLPTEITFGGGGTIEYLYDAAGIKLKKTVTDGTDIDITEYVDGFHYTGNQTNVNLDFFPTAEGYVKVIVNDLGGTVYNYVFQYMDHLGNIRMKYGQDPQNNYALTILEEDHYYPYGLSHEGYNGNHRVFDIVGGNITLTPVNSYLGDTYTYGFGGKEEQKEFGIAMYDFGARNYDPALGRWMNIDPLAEKMRRHSPYNYAFNNPILFTDPDGMAPYMGAGYQTGSYSVQNFSDSGGGYNIESLDADGKVLDSMNFDPSKVYGVNKDGKISILDPENSSDLGGCCGNDSNNAGGIGKGIVNISLDLIGAWQTPVNMVGGIITGDSDFEIIPRLQASKGEGTAYYVTYGIGVVLDPSPGGEAALISRAFKNLSKVAVSGDKAASAMGSALVKELKRSANLSSSGRSGGHGTPFKRAGAILNRIANNKSNGYTPEFVQSLKKAANRLLEQGKSINHK